MAITKFRILGTRRINIPARRATIGCNINAFKVKVTGLSPLYLGNHTVQC
jgi:hypothetical protein